MLPALSLTVYSDIHIEHNKGKWDKNLLVEGGDVLLLCGDISSVNYSHKAYALFLTEAVQKYNKVFLVPGNHEYYSKKSYRKDLVSYEESKEKLRDLADKTGVVLLDKASYEYRGYLFVGATLWYESDLDAEEIFNDYHCISNYAHETCSKLHKEEVEYLNNVITNSTLPTVVMTHHHPLNNKIRYSTTDLSHLFTDNVVLWACGHLHKALVKDRFICNPIGYPFERTGWKYGPNIMLGDASG